MDDPLVTNFQLNDEILLRAFRDVDDQAVYETVKRNEKHLMEFMHWMTPNYSLELTRDFIRRSNLNTEQRTGMTYGIFKAGRHIGAVGFVRFDWKSRATEIGYWIDKAEEGKGIVSAACKLLIDYAFGELGMNRVEIRCSTFNVRSAAIPERFGFKKEGVLRQSEFRNGRLHDFAMYGLLASEWK